MGKSKYDMKYNGEFMGRELIALYISAFNQLLISKLKFDQWRAKGKLSKEAKAEKEFEERLYWDCRAAYGRLTKLVEPLGVGDILAEYEGREKNTRSEDNV